MHDLIVQMSREKYDEIDNTPVNDFDLCEESNSDFIGDRWYEFTKAEIKEEKFEEFLEKLTNHGAEYNKEEGYIVFSEDFAMNYFKKKFELFEKIVDGFTLYEFSDTKPNKEFSLHMLQTCIENRFDTYIYEDYLITLDEFVRGIVPDKKYYIGNILGYHW